MCIRVEVQSIDDFKSSENRVIRGGSHKRPRRAIVYTLLVSVHRTTVHHILRMSSINFAQIERIDVHSHAITPKYREFLLQTGHQNPDGMPGIPVRKPRPNI